MLMLNIPDGEDAASQCKQRHKKEVLKFNLLINFFAKNPLHQPLTSMYKFLSSFITSLCHSRLHLKEIIYSLNLSRLELEGCIENYENETHPHFSMKGSQPERDLL